jgi:hypothetical protein
VRVDFLLSDQLTDRRFCLLTPRKGEAPTVQVSLKLRNYKRVVTVITGTCLPPDLIAVSKLIIENAQVSRHSSFLQALLQRNCNPYALAAPPVQSTHLIVVLALA